MSVTIDSLDIQIRSSAGSASNNIDKLADSLARLRDNASLTKVTNNLTKLAGALKTLNVTSSTLSSLKGLAGAMKSLAAVQSTTGLKKVFEQLERLPDLTTRLNPAALTAFSTAIRTLSDGLAPLATQIEKIGKGFSKLPARISQCVTATNRLTTAARHADTATEELDDTLDKQGINLMANIANFDTLVQALQRVGQVVVQTTKDAMEWDGIQFRFGQAFGDDAQEVYNWILKINEALGISTQEFMQYSGIYASLLKGFGVEQGKATDISVGLTELTYDIWAFSNDRYKNLEDAAEAVRSAITGEIEPIRNAGIALTEASMQEYLDTVGQAHVSIEKLTEAQKAEVRYAVMVNSAMQQGIVGTYAREMDTAEGAVRRLTQQMKTLGQAFGSLFIPVLQIAIPWLTAFVDILTDAVHWIAAFFGIKIAKIDWSGVNSGSTGLENIESGAADATDALGDTAKAAKKLRDYTLGFDELNVIEPPSSSSSGSGGAGGAAGGAAGNGFEGLELASLWDQALLDSATKKVDEIKAKILGFLDEFKTQIAIIAAALGVLGLTKLLSNMGEALQWGDKFKTMLKNIGKLASTAIVITLQYTLQTEFFKSYIDGNGFKEYVKALFVGALGTWVLYSMWGTAGLVIGLGVTAVAAFTATFEDGSIDSIEEVVTGLTGLATAVGAVVIAWKKVAPAIKESNLVRALQGVSQGSEAARSALTYMFPTLSRIGSLFGGAAKAVGTFVSGLSAGAVAGIVAIIAGIAATVLFLKNNWEEVTAAVKKFFDVNIVPKLNGIKESWDKIEKALKDVKDAFLDAIPPKFKKALEDMGDWIKDVIKKIKEWAKTVDWIKLVGEAFELVGQAIFNAISSQIAAAISAGIKIIEGFVRVVTGIVEIVSGVVEALIKLFSGDLQGAWDAVKKIGQGIADVFIGLYDMTIGAVIAFVEGIIDWFVALWDELVGHSIVPDMINAIVEWFLSLPKKILTPIQNFVDSIIEKFRDMWSSIQSWWASNVAPKFTAAYWQEKFDAIRKGASEKLDEAKTAITNKWSDIKTWFTTSVSPIFTLKYWQDKFDTVREGASEKLEAAKKAISDKWSDVKTWFSSNVASKFTANYWTDKFDVIRKGVAEKLDAAKKAISDKWSDIKNWWKSNVAPKFTVSYWQDKFDVIRKGISDKLDAAKKAIQDKWSSIRSWYSSNVAPKFTLTFWLDKFKNLKEGFTATIRNAVNAGIDLMNRFIWWINSRLSFSWEPLYLAGHQVYPGGYVQLFVIPTIPRLEQGGFLEDGLFTMNKGEIAGKFNNGKSVVANNQMIVDGIAAGVYQAVVAAMNDSQRQDSSVNVYLDGKQIYASVKKTESERGMRLMGSQLGYSY